MMSTPRKNPKKILKKFSAHVIFKKVFFRLFSRQMTHFSALMLFFRPYEPINTLEAFLGDFGPETEFSTLTEMINFQVFLKIAQAKNFLKIFLDFPEV